MEIPGIRDSKRLVYSSKGVQMFFPALFVYLLQHACTLSLSLCLQAVEGAVGLPVSVQCVALSWQEELCLRLMKEVETVVHEKRTNI